MNRLNEYQLKCGSIQSEKGKWPPQDYQTYLYCEHSCYHVRKWGTPIWQSSYTLKEAQKLFTRIKDLTPTEKGEIDTLTNYLKAINKHWNCHAVLTANDADGFDITVTAQDGDIIYQRSLEMKYGVLFDSDTGVMLTPESIINKIIDRIRDYNWLNRKQS